MHFYKLSYLQSQNHCLLIVSFKKNTSYLYCIKKEDFKKIRLLMTYTPSADMLPAMWLDQEQCPMAASFSSQNSN